MATEKSGKFIINALFLVLLIAGLSWLGTTIYSAAQLPIERVKIEGSFAHIGHEKVSSAVLPYVQGSFFSVDVMRLKQRLQQLPWVKQVSIFRLWPDTIIIRLLEQQAIAHWQGKYLLNSEGEIFDPAENIQSDSLPWLVGNDGDAQKLLATYHQMNNALHHLGLRITKLELTERQAWTLILDNGMKLVLGRVDPIQQITRFVHAYNSIFGSRGTAVQLVDLRYPNGIAVRWNKEKT